MIEFYKRMLADPNLSPEDRKNYQKMIDQNKDAHMRTAGSVEVNQEQVTFTEDEDDCAGGACKI